MLKSIGGSVFGAVVGFLVAFAPAAWIIVGPPEQHSFSFNFIGWFDFDIHVLPELLLASLAVGVAGALTWWEANLENEELGLVAGIYGACCAIGSIVSIIIYSAVKPTFLEWIKDEQRASYLSHFFVLIVAATAFNYFCCIIHLRYLKCMGNK